MKITVGQFDVKSKDLKHNYLLMEKLINEAINNNFEVIVFGEYALVGYSCADYFKSNSFYEEVEYYTQKLLAYSNDILIVFGSIKKINDNYYSGASILDGSEEYFSAKTNLNKRELNELAYFTTGENMVFTFNNKKYLITFRSDINNIAKFSYDYLIVLDSAPVNNLLVYSADVIYANTTGISAYLKAVFINGGNSYIKVNDKVFAFDNPLDTGIITKENNVGRISKLNALSKGIRVFSDETFGENKKWVVGNSGGIDSAVTLALLVIALGSDNVISYNLKSKYNSQKTIKNAEILANKLNVKHYCESIDELVDEAISTLNRFDYSEIDDLTLENVQARTRGHLLSAFSGLENAVISNNSNKLELALGYATMYGDTIGALSLIGDLVKVEVFELASEINHYFNDEIILNNLLPDIINYKVYFDTAPSAELKENQVDPIKFFYHDLLLDLLLVYDREYILSMYLDNQFEHLMINKWLRGYRLYNGKRFVEDFEYFTKTIQINQFKRLQTPPVLVYSNKVIGVDYLESALIKPESEKERELKTEIIKAYI